MRTVLKTRADYIYNLSYLTSKETLDKKLYPTLCGIHAEPHPEKGAFIVAHNKYAMGIFYDEAAKITRPITILPSKDLLSTCKTDSNGNASFFVLEDFLENGRTVFAVSSSSETNQSSSFKITQEASEEIKGYTISPKSLLDKSYPEWMSPSRLGIVYDANHDIQSQADNVSLDISLLQLFKFGKKEQHVNIFPTSPTVSRITLADYQNFVGVLSGIVSERYPNLKSPERKWLDLHL